MLTPHETCRVDRQGKTILAYQLFDTCYRDGTVPVFAGGDFTCSPLHAVDSDATVAAVLTLLSLRPGDTDQEFFGTYTPEQLAWCHERAAELSWAAQELEVYARWRRWHESGRTEQALHAIARGGSADDILDVLQLSLEEAIAAVATLAAEDDHYQVLLTQLAQRVAMTACDSTSLRFTTESPGRFLS